MLIAVIGSVVRVGVALSMAVAYTLVNVLKAVGSLGLTEYETLDRQGVGVVFVCSDKRGLFEAVVVMMNGWPDYGNQVCFCVVKTKIEV